MEMIAHLSLYHSFVTLNDLEEWNSPNVLSQSR